MNENGDGFRAIGATTYLCPTPTVLVGCAEDDGWQRGEGRANLITVAWVGVCCSHPPMIGIGIRPERYSHGLITRSGEFTVNLIGESLTQAMDFCGVRSGRDVDKFAELHLHAVAAPPLTAAPALREAPAHLCCKLRQVVPLGSHDLLLAEVLDVRVSDAYFRDNGSIDEQAMNLVAYVHGKYRALGPELGFFGFSVAGDDARQRRAMPAQASAARADTAKPSPERIQATRSADTAHTARRDARKQTSPKMKTQPSTKQSPKTPRRNPTGKGGGKHT